MRGARNPGDYRVSIEMICQRFAVSTFSNRSSSLIGCGLGAAWLYLFHCAEYTPLSANEIGGLMLSGDEVGCEMMGEGAVGVIMTGLQ